VKGIAACILQYGNIFLIFICNFYPIILNFFSFTLFGYDAKLTAGTNVDKVYEIVLDNICI